MWVEWCVYCVLKAQSLLSHHINERRRESRSNKQLYNAEENIKKPAVADINKMEYYVILSNTMNINQQITKELNYARLHT